MADIIGAGDSMNCRLTTRPAHFDSTSVLGRYNMICRDPAGNIKWVEDYDNVVTTAGKNLMLDDLFAASGAAAFMGLISSVSYAAGVVIADTMGTHGGWFEVSATTYYPTVAARLSCAWSAASAGAKALSAGLTFTIITNPGTIKGSFIVGGSGAVATLGSTLGTLISGGTFTGGDRVVAVSDTVTVSYTLTLT